MGLSYNPKPDFIERLIEDAAFQFFKAFSCFTEAGAATELGEKIGFPPSVITLLTESEWNLSRAAELYESLFLSIENIPIEPGAAKGMSSFDFDAMISAINSQGTVTIAPKVFSEFEASVRSGNPVNVIRAYARRIEKTKQSLEEFRESVSSGKMDAVSGHKCLTNFMETTIYGQYVATLNRMSREQSGAGGARPTAQEQEISEIKKAELEEAFSSFDSDAEMKEPEPSGARRMSAAEFCDKWDTVKAALEFLAQVPQVPSLIRRAIGLVIKAGDLVSRTIC